MTRRALLKLLALLPFVRLSPDTFAETPESSPLRAITVIRRWGHFRVRMSQLKKGDVFRFEYEGSYPEWYCADGNPYLDNNHNVSTITCHQVRHSPGSNIVFHPKAEWLDEIEVVVIGGGGS